MQLGELNNTEILKFLDMLRPIRYMYVSSVAIADVNISCMNSDATSTVYNVDDILHVSGAYVIPEDVKYLYTSIRFIILLIDLLLLLVVLTVTLFLSQSLL